ncbi:hypothetical protein D3C72_1033320 [compost metagenome]
MPASPPSQRNPMSKPMFGAFSRDALLMRPMGTDIAGVVTLQVGAPFRMDRMVPIMPTDVENPGAC